jgi:hypothetical protein
MSGLAKIEGDEIVIRIPLDALRDAARHQAVEITDPVAFAPAFVDELNAEDEGEDLLLNAILDAALVRAVEADAPGCQVPWMTDE